ncbi:MAG: hypothetical protein R3E40_04290 [Rhodocyclaceae bacterium]
MPKRPEDKSTQVNLPTLPAHALDRPPEGVGEDVWIDVIRKMDEVYSDLLQYEVALEEKNAKLEETQKFIFSVLTSMSDVRGVRPPRRHPGGEPGPGRPRRQERGRTARHPARSISSPTRLRASRRNASCATCTANASTTASCTSSAATRRRCRWR